MNIHCESNFSELTCLFSSGLQGVVPRYHSIKYSGINGLTGEKIERVVKGFHARVLQHECDHLDGILYTERITDIRNLIFRSEYELFSAGTK
jgi:peptide deformylase